MPWFDRPLTPRPRAEPVAEAEDSAAQSVEPPASAQPPPEPDDDLFDRHDADAPRVSAEPTGEVWPLRAPPASDEGAAQWPHASAASPERRWEPSPDPVPEPSAPADQVPAWAWPASLETGPEPPSSADRLRAAPEPAPPEPVRSAAADAAAAAPAAGKPLDPDAARAISRIRRLMLVSNLFMVIGIAAVLGVVG